MEGLRGDGGEGQLGGREQTPEGVGFKKHFLRRCIFSVIISSLSILAQLSLSSIGEKERWSKTLSSCLHVIRA